MRKAVSCEWGLVQPDRLRICGLLPKCGEIVDPRSGLSIRQTNEFGKYYYATFSLFHAIFNPARHNSSSPRSRRVPAFRDAPLCRQQLAGSRLRITFSCALSLRIWFSSNSDGSSGLPLLARRSGHSKSMPKWRAGCINYASSHTLRWSTFFPLTGSSPERKTTTHSAIHHMHNRNFICCK